MQYSPPSLISGGGGCDAAETDGFVEACMEVVGGGVLGTTLPCVFISSPFGQVGYPTSRCLCSLTLSRRLRCTTTTEVHPIYVYTI
jgi:hypothetical protein